MCGGRYFIRLLYQRMRIVSMSHYCSMLARAEALNIQADVIRKKGKSGRDWTRTNDLTDVNPQDREHARDVILLVVESFNN